MESSLIHFVLAHSYIMYFFGLIAGLVLDFFLPYRIPGEIFNTIGYVLLLLGPALIFWAQIAVRKSAPKRHAHQGQATLCRDHFCVGPYVITRSPTHWGLFIMVIGLGLAWGSLAIIIMCLLSFAISRSIYLRRQESLLEAKYGDAYRDYKSHVKL